MTDAETTTPLSQSDTVTILPSEFFDELVASLDEPAKPIPELVALFKRARVTLAGEDGESSGEG